MARCGTCKAEILWKTLHGQPHAVDAQPVRGGNLSMASLDGQTLEVVAPDPRIQRYVSHNCDRRDAA